MTLRNVLIRMGQTISALALTVLFSSQAQAQSALTYQGRIIKPDGRPLNAAQVNITVQIKSPGSENCLLFQETHVVDMTDSAGIFTLNIGTGVRASSSVDGGFPLGKVFSNTSTDIKPLPNCAFGDTYRPNMADVRKLIVSFNDGSGVQTLAAQNINFVPFAIEASQLTGFTADNLLRAPNTNVPPLTSSDMNKLLDLINGTSPIAGDITGNQGSTVVTALQGNPVSSTPPASNQVLKWNGSSWAPAADSFSGTFSGDIGGSISTTIVNAIQGNAVSNSAPSSNDVLKWNGTEWAPAPDSNAGGTLTSVSLNMPSIFSVTGSPMTGTSGTFGVSLSSQPANSVLAAPDSAAGSPTFRTLVENDIPHLSSAGKVSGNAITSGTIGGSTAISTTGSISTSNNIITSGRFVAGAASTTTAKVEVTGQVLSKVHNAGGATSIDWNNGNVQYTSANCGAMTFSNMFEGGAYTLIVTGTSAGTCTFSQSSPDSVPAGSFKFVPGNGPSVAGKTTVFTMLRAGNVVYVSWIAGY